jgi:hypothetical protein
MHLKLIGNVFTSKFVGNGASSNNKIDEITVSQKLRNIGVGVAKRVFTE